MSPPLPWPYNCMVLCSTYPRCSRGRITVPLYFPGWSPYKWCIEPCQCWRALPSLILSHHICDICCRQLPAYLWHLICPLSMSIYSLIADVPPYTEGSKAIPGWIIYYYYSPNSIKFDHNYWTYAPLLLCYPFCQLYRFLRIYIIWGLYVIHGFDRVPTIVFIWNCVVLLYIICYLHEPGIILGWSKVEIQPI